MPKRLQTTKEAVVKPAEEKLVFPKKITVRLDEDVRALLTASVERGVKWTSVTHAANATMRRSLLPFKTDGLMVRIDPFEQLVFAKPKPLVLKRAFKARK